MGPRIDHCLLACFMMDIHVESRTVLWVQQTQTFMSLPS